MASVMLSPVLESRFGLSCDALSAPKVCGTISRRHITISADRIQTFFWFMFPSFALHPLFIEYPPFFRFVVLLHPLHLLLNERSELLESKGPAGVDPVHEDGRGGLYADPAPVADVFLDLQKIRPPLLPLLESSSCRCPDRIGRPV